MGSDDEIGDDVQASDSDQETMCTAGPSLDSVPVDVSGAAIAKLSCKLCFGKPTEKSPLALPTDWKIKLLEWRAYRKMKLQEKIISRKPRGRLCNWCARTFFQLGWEDEFSSISLYAKTINNSNRERHQKFLASRKEVIKHHLKYGPESGKRHRISEAGKKNVSDAVTTLDTIKGETARLEKPKMQFVRSDVWDEKLDGGKFDSSKEVTEMCFGKLEKGIWKKVR